VFLFLFYLQLWNPDAILKQCKRKRLVCKLTAKHDIDMMYPFAEYSVSTLWPYGRVIRNLSEFHGECRLMLMYLGQNVNEATETIKLLQD